MAAVKNDRDKRKLAARIAIGKRVEAARKFAGISGVEMGRRLGYKAAHMYYRKEKGIRGFDPSQLEQVARITGTRIDYLTSGSGTMRSDGAEPPHEHGEHEHEHEHEHNEAETLKPLLARRP